MAIPSRYICAIRVAFDSFSFCLNSLQDEAAFKPKVDKKLKEKSIDATLFDDNVDIFADLTDTFKPKQKSKLKGETKSIFDDDMGKRQCHTSTVLYQSVPPFYVTTINFRVDYADLHQHIVVSKGELSVQ